MSLIEILFPVFGIIGLGWFSRKIKIIRKSWVKVLNHFAYYIALPAIIFISLYNVDFGLFSKNLIIVNVISICLMIGAVYFLSKFMKFKDELKAVFLLCSVFGNVVYIGFPINQLSFGSEGIIIATVISAIHIIFSITFGIFVLQYYSGKKIKMKKIVNEIIKIPLLWAVIIGLLFSYFKLPLPDMLFQLFSILGNAALPVALFSLGSFLYGSFFKENIKEALMLSSLKLILMPIFVLLFINVFHLSGKRLAVSLLQAGMPVAVATFVLVKGHENQKKIVANSILISTILSLVTISVLLEILNIYYF